MANQDEVIQDEGQEEATTKKGGDLVFYIVFFLISSVLTTGGMYFALSKKIAAQNAKKAEMADSLGVNDSTGKSGKDSLSDSLKVAQTDSSGVDSSSSQKDSSIVVSATKGIQASADEEDDVTYDDRVKQLSKIYAAMDPEKAAKQLAYLPDSLAAQIVLAMQTRASGKVMENVPPEKAGNVSQKILKTTGKKPK